MKRINIITGHFGSGKTEFAINLAQKQTMYEKSVIADMDTVNPYFRTNDARKSLEEKGIKVLASDYASSNLDIPSLPSDLYSLFDVEDRFAVLDVGGDEDGATVLGRFYNKLKDADYDMYMVINARRVLSQTADEIITFMREIEVASRLKITKLVNNTNLSVETTPEVLLEGQKVVEEVSLKTGLPIAYITGTKEILDKIPDTVKAPRLCLDLNMNLPF
ncbi:MAG: hypothetical protein IKJ06_00640 [Clostridia bacterium]|nr:hypothetical protein [Clostridia bacterium]